MTRTRAGWALIAALAATSCAGLQTTAERAASQAADARPPSARGTDAAAAASASVTPDRVDAGDTAPPLAADADPSEREPTFSDIAEVLFLDRSAPGALACPDSLAVEARVRCLYEQRYKGDAKAAGLAHEMLAKWSTIAGVEPPRTYDGGYRGTIHLVPAVPTGADRKHLEWISASIRDFDQFFEELARHGQERAAAPSTKRYRFRGLRVRFMRSTNTNRPSAYAYAWTIGYNLVGSLNLNADKIRETMFHEVFHLNDAAHGQWSSGALGAIFDALVKKCGASTQCLAPYAPGDTMVRGGTYYAFQPGNGGGVLEYAAELAVRYYREQRAVLRSARLAAKPFKCGPPENAKAWALMKDEFFAGIDATPACP